MIEVHDYSYLSPVEAREKVRHLYWRVYSEQFHSNFFVKDLRPEKYLKYEIHAFFEGRISEMHGWADPIGQLKDWFKNYIVSALQNFWADILRPGIEAIFSAFSWIWQSTLDFVRWTYDKVLSIYNMVSSVQEWVQGTMYGMLVSSWNTLKNIGSIILAKAREAINVVWNWLVQVWEDRVKPWFEAMFAIYKAIWDATKEYAQSAVVWAQNVHNKIIDVWNDIVEKVSGSFEALSKQMAALPQAIAAGFQNALQVIYDILSRFWGNIVLPAVEKLKDALSWIGNQIINTFYTVWDHIISVLDALSPMSPEAGENALYTLLKVAGLSAAGLLAMTAVWDVIHPFKDVIPGEVKAMLYDVTNFRAILGVLQGILIGEIIRAPAKYAFNARFRPYLPQWSDVMELRSRGMISDKEFLSMMHYFGYDAKWKKWFDELAITPATFTMLRYAAMYGFYDPGTFRIEVQRMGHSEFITNVILNTLTGEFMSSVRRYYVDRLWDRYAMGIINKEQLKQELRSFGFPPPQVGPLVQVADLIRDTKMVEDLIYAYRTEYERGKISLQEFQVKLKSLGLDDEAIKVLTEVVTARTFNEIYQTDYERVKVYGDTTVRNRFKYGAITPAEFKEEMRMLGYSDWWAERLLIVARLERDLEFIKDLISIAERALEKGKIDEVTFIQTLKAFGVDPDFIEKRLSLVRIKRSWGLT
ncbi:hypothetical protein J7J18_02655 [bacterium]|nr:hypothetical protein [bacterium]